MRKRRHLAAASLLVVGGFALGHYASRVRAAGIPTPLTYSGVVSNPDGTPRGGAASLLVQLFDLESGIPTDAYALNDAVDDGFLVPARAVSVPLKFQREGIKYAETPVKDRITNVSKKSGEARLLIHKNALPEVSELRI